MKSLFQIMEYRWRYRKLQSELLYLTKEFDNYVEIKDQLKTITDALTSAKQVYQELIDR